MDLNHEVCEFLKTISTVLRQMDLIYLQIVHNASKHEQIACLKDSLGHQERSGSDHDKQ